MKTLEPIEKIAEDELYSPFLLNKEAILMEKINELIERVNLLSQEKGEIES